MQDTELNQSLRIKAIPGWLQGIYLTSFNSPLTEAIKNLSSLLQGWREIVSARDQFGPL